MFDDDYTSSTYDPSRVQCPTCLILVMLGSATVMIGLCYEAYLALRWMF